MIRIDIPMPEHCYDCPCHDGESGFCQITGKSYYDEIPRSCPLVELPSVQPELFGNSKQLDGEYDPRPDIYYLAEKIGIHRLYALVVQLRGEPESCIDTIGRQAAIDALKDEVRLIDGYYTMNDEVINKDDAIEAIRLLPYAQPELTWETCFDCPLSNGCPKISGCTNDQAEQYASEIPADCPLNKASVHPERKKGKWLMADDIPSICSNCGTNWIDDYVDSSELYFTGKIPNFCPNCGSDNRGEQDEE